MTAVVAEKVVVELEAKMARYRAETERSRSMFERAMDRMGRAAERTEGKVSRSSLMMSSSLTTIATALGTGVAVRQVQVLTDRYTRLTNAIAAAGDAAEHRAMIEDRLFAAGVRNGAQVNALAALYRRTTQANDQLGASLEERLRLTEGIAAALRVEGISATQASGPLMQLGQAMASPIVRAEELNSVLEGVPEIARAAARGLGVLVPELRQMVLDGDLSNVELFNGLLRGLEETERKAADVSLTIANATTVMVDALSRYVGRADDSLGATERLTQGIVTLSENLDTVAGLAAAAATVFGARVGSQIVASLTAQIAATRESARAHNERIQTLRSARVAEVQSTEAAVRANAARLQEIRTTRAQIGNSLQAAQAQKAQALAYLQLQQGLIRAGAGTGQLANAKAQLANASRNVIRLQRLERQVTGELTAAIAAQTATTNAASLAQTQYNRVLRRTGAVARITSAAMVGLRSVMGFFGGPIGVAITGIAAGIALIAHRAGEAERRATRLATAYEHLGREVDEFGEATDRAEKAQRALQRIEQERARGDIAKAIRDQRRELRPLEREAARVQRVLDSLYRARERNPNDISTPQIPIQEENLASLQAQVEETRAVIADLEDGLEGLNSAQEDSNRSTQRAIDLASIRRRADQELADALTIVARTMGEASEAQRLLNDMQRAESIDRVTQALGRQQDALADLNRAITDIWASEGVGFPMANPGEGLSSEGQDQVSALEAERAVYERRIQLFEEFLEALRTGRAELNGAADAERERAERIRNEARSIEEAITREGEFARALAETQEALDKGEVGPFRRQVEQLTDELAQTTDALAVLDAQLEAGLITEQAYGEEAGRLAATLEQLRDLMERLGALRGRAEGLEAESERVKAQERLNALLADEMEHELALARLRGDDRVTRDLQRRLFIQERITALMKEQELSEQSARQQATQEADQLDAARRYGEARDLFSRSFSDGIRAAMSGDLRNFLSNSFGTIADEGLQRLGGALFDRFFNAGADLAQAQAEGAAQGAAASVPMSAAITTSTATGATVMANAIIAAGFTAGQAMAAAITAANVGSTATNALSFATAASGLPGRANGGRVAAGQPYLVGERGPEPFVPDTSGFIIPNSALKALSEAGDAPRVGPTSIRLEVAEGEMFEVRVTEVAGPLAQQASVQAVTTVRSDLAKVRKRQSRRL